VDTSSLPHVLVVLSPDLRPPTGSRRARRAALRRSPGFLVTCTECADQAPARTKGLAVAAARIHARDAHAALAEISETRAQPRGLT
jgi:hypothetical protein